MAIENALENLVARMTVGELAQRSGRSVADIAVFALGGAAVRGPRVGSPKPNGVARGKPSRDRGGSGHVEAKRVDTRTQQGRATYERDVLAALQKSSGKTSAQDIRKQVGGTPEQARVTLNRLIELGKVQYEGQARATRYWAK